MYQCKHFIIQELVPPHIYHKRGDKAWELLDAKALRMLDAVRERFGVTTVNNWHLGRDREWSGLRTADSPYFSATSQHTFGRAFDCIFNGVSAEDARRYILAHSDEFPFITSMELGTSWLHFDVRNCDAVKTFYP